MKLKMLVRQLPSLFFALVWMPTAWAQVSGDPLPPFAETPRPPAPDYADSKSWAALPGREDLADLVPQGSARPDSQDIAPADVFYIHPTTYLATENWNQDLAMSEVNRWTDTSVIARQASAFNACCKIYAPRYRQATLGSAGAMDRGGMDAYDFAYGDVLRAWHHYLENWNRGRPVLIVGHSQGALHALRLLEEEVDSSPVAERLVAGYVIGIATPVGRVARTLKTIPVCRDNTDTGCLLFWNTYDRSGDPSGGIARAQKRYRDTFATVSGQDIICWSPTARNGGVNTGALPGDPKSDSLADLVAGPDASCEGGILWTDTPTGDAFHLTLIPGGNLHYHDFDLCYEDIRLNAVDRVQAFLSR